MRKNGVKGTDCTFCLRKRLKATWSPDILREAWTVRFQG
jgi:hypothetical protein